MTTFGALLAKEELALFSSPVAYTVIAVFLLLLGYTFTTFLFINKVGTLVHVFFQTAVLLLLLVPVLTMRFLAEERKQGTLEVLLTSPVTEIAIVLAKFVAGLTLVVLMLVLSGSYAVVLGLYGSPDWGPIYSGYFGLFLLGAALVAVGLMTSSLVNNQIIAALLSLSLFLLLGLPIGVAAAARSLGRLARRPESPRQPSLSWTQLHPAALGVGPHETANRQDCRHRLYAPD